MNSPETLCVPKYLTQVYATPEQNAPKSAAKAPRLISPLPVGLIINPTPIKAIIIANNWNLVIFSLKNIYDKIIITNGDSFCIIV